MAAMDEPQVAATEMERLRPKVATLFEREGVFYAKILKRPVEIVSNRNMLTPLEMNPGGDFAQFDPAGGALGTGGGPSWDKGSMPPTFLRWAGQWTKKAEWATDDARKSVLNTTRWLVSKAMAEFRRHMDSLCMTAGNGVLGTVTSVSNSGGFDTVTLNTDGYAARLLRFGTRITYYLANLSAVRHATGVNTPITYYDLIGKQIKTATTTGLAATDLVGLAGMASANPVSFLGVPYHHSNASSGTWLGIDRALNPQVRATRVNAAGTFALPFARLAMNKLGDRIGIDNEYAPEAWMHPCQKGAYEELGQLVSLMNMSAGASGGESRGLNLYYGGKMQMAGANVNVSNSWDKTRIDFVIYELWGRGVMKEADFYKNKAGQMFFELRDITDGSVKTAELFYITVAHNMFMTNPAAGCYIDGLTIPSGY